MDPGQTGSGRVLADGSCARGRIGFRNAAWQDAGRPRKKGSSVVGNACHIHSTGAPGSERRTRLDIGFRFHPTGYQPKTAFFAYTFGRTDLEIDPNEPNQRQDAYYVAPQAMK